MSALRIGHRGACGHAPENTLLSMRKALELGCDAIECDVHRCKSGEVVVIHDATLQRTTGARGRVSDFTLAELKRLDAGNGETIPTLEEVIAVMCGKMVFIEIKDEAAILPVADMVTHAGRSQGYENLPVISFEWNYLLQVQKINSSILLGATPPERGIRKGFAQKAKDAGMWSANPSIKILDEAFMREANTRGLKVFTWTANTQAQIARAKALGVDGIISDFPERI